MSAAESAGIAADLTVTVVDLAPVPMQGTGRPMGTLLAEAESSAVLALRHALSVATIRLLEGTPNPAARPVRARAPSAATIMADKPDPTRHAAAPAWGAGEREAAEDLVVAVAGIGDQRCINFQKVRET